MKAQATIETRPQLPHNEHCIYCDGTGRAECSRCEGEGYVYPDGSCVGERCDGCRGAGRQPRPLGCWRARWVAQPVIGYLCRVCGRAAPKPEASCERAAPVYPIQPDEPAAQLVCGRESGRPPAQSAQSWDAMLKVLRGRREVFDEPVV
jgi:hypothetical protein